MPPPRSAAPARCPTTRRGGEEQKFGVKNLSTLPGASSAPSRSPLSRTVTILAQPRRSSGARVPAAVPKTHSGSFGAEPPCPRRSPGNVPSTRRALRGWVAAETHLLVRDGDEALLGKLPQRVQVRPHVQLAAHQHDLGVGAELLSLPLPLQWRQEREGARL